jgi:hypothetical protein
MRCIHSGVMLNGFILNDYKSKKRAVKDYIIKELAQDFCTFHWTAPSFVGICVSPRFFVFDGGENLLNRHSLLVPEKLTERCKGVVRGSIEAG